MSRSLRSTRLTVYDVMDAKGVFDSNPANAQARDDSTGTSLYDGPVEYPKMMYHPQGERKVVVPGEDIVTPFGPKRVGEQTEIVSRVVRTAAEEDKLREDGWHYHPADAIAAGGGEAPDKGADATIQRLEAELARLRGKAPDVQQEAKKVAKLAAGV